MKRVLRIMAAGLLLCTLAIGCTDSNIGQFKALGSEHQITLYSGGTAVKVWKSTGKVHTEDKSDGYFFVDKNTNRLVRVSGTIIIEQLN